MASNDIPIGYTGFAGLSAGDNAIRWHPLSAGTIEVSTFSDIGWNELDKIKGGQSAIADDNSVVMFGHSDTFLIFLTGDQYNTSIGVAVSSNKIDENTDLTFTSISGIHYNNNYLYILDGSFVYKYNVESFINGDQNIQRRWFLDESIGGTGKFDQPGKFDTPSSICLLYTSPSPRDS